VRSWMATAYSAEVHDITQTRLFGPMDYAFRPDGTIVVFMAVNNGITTPSRQPQGICESRQ